MSNQLAIKYRPARFADVIGQQTTVAELQRRLHLNAVPQTIFFSGMTGTGKNTLGFLLAKALVCRSRIDEEPCNKCDQCLAVDSRDFNLAVKCYNGSNLKIDPMRGLEEEIMTPDWQNPEGLRVFFIEEWQEVEQKAQKNILPLLERDLPGVHIIVLAMDTDKIPRANRDRLVEYRMKPVKASEIMALCARILAAEGAISSSHIELVEAIADNSGGSVRGALAMLERVIYSGITSKQQLIEELGITTEADIRDICAQLTKKDRQVLKRTISVEIFDACRRHLLNALMYSKSGEQELRVLQILNRANLYPYADALLLKSLMAEVVFK